MNLYVTATLLGRECTRKGPGQGGGGSRGDFAGMGWKSDGGAVVQMPVSVPCAKAGVHSTMEGPKEP